jgi:prevent-host-death family protein
MTTVSLFEAQANLSELIHRLALGGEVVVTEYGRPVARIVAAGTVSAEPALGTGRLKFPLYHSRQPGALAAESMHRAEEQMYLDEDASHAGPV